MNINNHYKVLGINNKATKDEIKIAYNNMIQVWHPDKNKNNKKLAESQCKKINEAFKVLSNPQKRMEYDITLNMDKADSDTESTAASDSDTESTAASDSDTGNKSNIEEFTSFHLENMKQQLRNIQLQMLQHAKANGHSCEELNQIFSNLDSPTKSSDSDSDSDSDDNNSEFQRELAKRINAAKYDSDSDDNKYVLVYKNRNRNSVNKPKINQAKKPKKAKAKAIASLVEDIGKNTKVKSTKEKGKIEKTKKESAIKVDNGSEKKVEPVKAKRGRPKKNK